jgi:nitrite reductase/ring-hydroxylating ferredoxin subunit
MRLIRKPSPEPLWRDEFSVFSGDEKYVSRRQFSKFLVLASLGMFVGNLWILVRSWFSRKPTFPVTAIARAEEISIGGVKLFPYPTAQEQCILLRNGPDSYVAYSQKCTHLSCAVFYSPAANRFECPCHNGAFSVQDGSPLQGPPRRPLPRIVLSRKGDVLFASGIQLDG